MKNTSVAADPFVAAVAGGCSEAFCRRGRRQLDGWRRFPGEQANLESAGHVAADFFVDFSALRIEFCESRRTFAGLNCA